MTSARAVDPLAGLAKSPTANAGERGRTRANAGDFGRTRATTGDRITSAIVAPYAKVLTVSQSVHAGAREDRSGTALADLLAQKGFEVIERRTVPDGVEPVASALVDMAKEFNGLIVTTGGTGFSPTDLTPEATLRVVDRQAPGLAEAMRAVSPLGQLSRSIAGTRGACLILNVPGSPSGATESLAAVVDVIPHALDLLAGGKPH